MQFKTKFIIILLLALFLNITLVSANEVNSTDLVELNTNGTTAVETLSANDVLNNAESEVDEENPLSSKQTTGIEINESSDSNLEKSPETLLSSDNSDATQYSTTVTDGIVTLPANQSNGTDILKDSAGNYNTISKTPVSKLTTRIIESANFVVKGKYIYFQLVDSNGNPIPSKKLTIKVNGKKIIKSTNSLGKVKLKIKSPKTIKIKFAGDSRYKASSKKIKIRTVDSGSINIGNIRLLSNGYLRVYLKVAGKPVSKKVTLTVGGKKLTKKANSEGIVIFKPSVKPGSYEVKAKVGKFYSAKSIKCYLGNPMDPLKVKIPYRNGKPDIDAMPGNYVMGDGNAKYTLKKSQFREVITRDSYCLFLNNKLTKYTFFKTKASPKLNHIVKREKWNVIERAINAKIVKKNKFGYWPSKITVSLKGKSYKYPEMRDVQNTGFTCGPASASMCTQTLKNYLCEKYISKLSKTTNAGTSATYLKRALDNHNFQTTYFHRYSFDTALNELKKGGCALIFHAKNHCVSIIDISSNGKKVLVSNSYHSLDRIPTKWVKVSYMRGRFSHVWDESLIVRLNYKLSDSTKNSVNTYYASMGTNWVAKDTHQSIGRAKG